MLRAVPNALPSHRPSPEPLEAASMTSNPPLAWPIAGPEVLHEDPHFLVVNKPSGLLAVPGRGPEKQDCAVHRLQQRWPEALTVHRLDMDTSGLLVYARGIEAQRVLNLAFEKRRVGKRYEALVQGLLAEDTGTVDAPLIADWPNRPKSIVDPVNGKPSVTHWRVLARDPALNRTRVSLQPITGRSHQLRVHLLHLGHPILGDILYGSDSNRLAAPRLMLHAAHLAFAHPVSGEALAFDCPAPF